MNGISISAAQLPAELLRREAATRKALERGIIAAAHRARAHLVSLTPKDQGQAKAAWRVALRRAGALVTELFNDAPYIGVLEAGARPHPVSEDGRRAIYEWVARHLRSFAGAERAEQIRKRRKSVTPAQFREFAGTVKRIGDAIIRRLQKYGAKPTYFIRAALPELTTFASEEVSRELEALAKRGKGTS